VNILKVSSDGTSEFSTISEAISKAEPNSRILVSKGIYEESLLIDKPLEIIADDERDKVVIAPLGNAGILINSNSVFFRGFKVRGHIGSINGVHSRQYMFCGVRIMDASPIIEECDIWTNFGFALDVEGESANPIIRHTKIHGESMGVFFGFDCRGILEESEICNLESLLIRITHRADPIIRNCLIHDGLGIETVVDAKGLIEDCEIFNTRSAAIDFVSKTHTIVRRCKIHDVARGIVNSYKTNRVESCEIFRVKEYVPKMDERPTDFK
jgi:F-box protein 11